MDNAGADVPFQWAQPNIFGGGSRILLEATVPANGYRVYRLLLPKKGEDEAGAQPEDPDAPTAGSTWLQNRYWRLELNASCGHVSRLIDRKTGRNLLSGPACALLVIDDPGDTWGHDIASWRDEIGRFGNPKFRPDRPGRLARHAGSRHELEQLDGTAGVHALSRFAAHRRRLTVDWHEHYRMLKLSVPTAVQSGVLTYDAPYSTITREANGQEDPGQTWIDLSGTVGGAPYGMSLLKRLQVRVRLPWLRSQDVHPSISYLLLPRPDQA